MNTKKIALLGLAGIIVIAVLATLALHKSLKPGMYAFAEYPDSASITVTKDSGRYAIEISSINDSNQNICSIGAADDQATWAVSNHFVAIALTNKKDDCAIKLTPQKDGVDLHMSGDCSAYCGANVALANGHYDIADSDAALAKQRAFDLEADKQNPQEDMDEDGADTPSPAVKSAPKQP